MINNLCQIKKTFIRVKSLIESRGLNRESNRSKEDVPQQRVVGGSCGQRLHCVDDAVGSGCFLAMGTLELKFIKTNMVNCKIDQIVTFM